MNKILDKTFSNNCGSEYLKNILIDLIKTTNCFIGGSFILSILHNEYYKTADIDIFCSVNNIEDIINKYELFLF